MIIIICIQCSMVNFIQFSHATQFVRELWQQSTFGCIQASRKNPKYIYYLHFRLQKLFQFHTKTLRTMIEMSRVTGSVLFGLLLINAPLNAFMGMMLVSQNLDKVHAFFILLLVIYQAYFIFGLHLMAVSYPRRIHKPSKYLLSLAATAKTNRLNFRTRLQLSHFIFRLHTKNRHTISYGPAGPVSYRTFFKVRFPTN